MSEIMNLYILANFFKYKESQNHFWANKYIEKMGLNFVIADFLFIQK